AAAPLSPVRGGRSEVGHQTVSVAGGGGTHRTRARPALTDLAVELGYFDQAHFIKDFKAVLGQTPAEYRTAARHALGARRGEGASENEQGSDARAPVPGLDKRPGRAVES